MTKFWAIIFGLIATCFGLAAILSVNNLIHHFRDSTVWYNSGIMAGLTVPGFGLAIFISIKFFISRKLSADVEK